jgi:hypothetical protein
MAQPMFGMKMTQLRYDKFRAVQRILGEATQSRALDTSLDIVINLYAHSDELARAQLAKIIDEKHLTNFIIKKVQ